MGVMAQQITELKDVDVQSRTNYHEEIDFKPNTKVGFRLTYTSETPLVLFINGNTYALEKSEKEKGKLKERLKYVSFYTNESGKINFGFQGVGDSLLDFKIQQVVIEEPTEHLGHR